MRFTSTSGLAVPAHKPLNSFRWVGPGTLLISEGGITVTAKRWSLLGLRQIRHFIPSVEISDVYREATAVQVHLRGVRAPYFRMWAENAASAAQLVALLPTRHTIEFESEFSEPPVTRTWRGQKVWLVALLAVAALGVLAWLAGHRQDALRTVPVRPPETAGLPQPKPAPTPAEAAATRADILLAEADLALVGSRIETLASEFSTAFDALMDGRLNQQKFADELEQRLLPQWDDLEAKVRAANAAPHSRHERADIELLGAINYWQLALRTYPDDLRHERLVVRPFEYLRSAELHRGRAQQMQSDLEQAPR